MRASNQGFLPVSVEHYVMLLDWTGWNCVATSVGRFPSIWLRSWSGCELNCSNWVEHRGGFGRLFKQAAGRSSSLIDAAACRSRRGFQGKAAAQIAFV